MSGSGDFISRELAVANCREYEDEYFGTVVALPVFALMNLPSADVVTRDEYAKVALERDYAVEELRAERKRGHWLELDDCMTVCSVCSSLGCGTNYCPYCGANMMEDNGQFSENENIVK